MKFNNTYPAGLLQPLPIPISSRQDISMDFVEGLPNSQGKNVIMVVVDRFTKYAHFVALKHPFTAKEIAHLFVTSVVRLHGIPKTIVCSDVDIPFWHSPNVMKPRCTISCSIRLQKPSGSIQVLS